GYLLASVLIEQSRLEEASEVLRSQKERLPNSFFPYLGLVRLAVAQGDLDSAALFARETEKRIPSNYPWGSYELAALMLFVQGERDFALRLLRSAGDHLPRNESRYSM